jgi:hypothetical protein
MRTEVTAEQLFNAALIYYNIRDNGKELYFSYGFLGNEFSENVLLEVAPLTSV